MADQLSLALQSTARDEAKRRGLDVEGSIAEQDKRVVGLLGAAIANLNFILEDAASSGYEVVLTVFHQDVARGPRRAVVRGRIRRLAVDARV